MERGGRVAGLPAVRGMAPEVRRTVVRQDAVVTTAQLVGWGYASATVRRRVASGDWQRPFRGVVVLQSGPTSWRQRARAALLYAGPGAALTHRSAAYHHGVVRDPGPVVHVVVPHARAVTAQRGLVVHRTRRTRWSGGVLPAVEPAEAVLDMLADAATPPGAGTTAVRRDVTDAVVGLICDAVRGGVRPEALLSHARRRGRLPGRALLLAMLDEVRAGVESPLEHRFTRDVERAHGLPRGVAQRWERVDGRWIRADRVYVGLGVRAELDGSLAHPFGATDDDVWRDNAVLLTSGDTTLRYRWRHVAVTPCATAAQLATALRARAWRGHPRPCSPACPLAA
ncbi:hypothetical protein [Cellulomonas sp. PSBB021]|uniref:hypothetical protein n=1 Tax=Cellulomonas sp. PSBB021 TaxID=2003551 RepID=UPI001E4E4C83|nr:hypothetical protein [Cellulomonas sp. PSBB021]